MKRDYRFDIARVLCMTCIVAYVHLYGYIYNVKSAYFIPECAVLTDACLGLFTFISGSLIGVKYCFSNKWGGVWQFYKKRLLRIFPLFLLAAIALYLIGFNGGRATLNGVLCISPFVKPAPMTLWYIPVIMICYLLTPLICRKGFLWRFISALGIFAVICVLRKLVPSMDWRLQFNLFFYLMGLVSAPYFDWKFSKIPWMKWLIIVLFVVLLIIAHIYAPSSLYKRFFAGIGVFAVLFVCDGLSEKIFKTENSVAKILTDISYASMACYMFHRFFFWGGEIVWNPSCHWLKWLYMAGVVFPIMLTLSFYIQKWYDKLVKNL